MKNNKILFSITKKDFRIDEFCSGGPGGQNQNKRKTGIRITHINSGAVGESREHRTKEANKKVAFKRLSESKDFKIWLKLEVSSRMKGYSDTEKMVDEMMKDKNLKVELCTDGVWNELKY